jgi:hypothetical protein
MAEIIYLYPKTSCPCEETPKTCTKPSGPKTNMSVRGCDLPKCADFYDRIGLGSSIQPSNKSGWYELNPQVYTDKYATGFGKVPCKQPKGCDDPTYTSLDPRLISAAHNGQVTVLDRPPIDGDVLLKNVYNSNLDNYGTGFMPYDQIRDGQIVYYVDRSIEDAYFKPVFASKANEISNIYIDPMGGVKPEYTRIQEQENPSTNCRTPYSDNLSFIQDTQSHREDLMSYQMRKRNQQRWETRWSRQD